MNAIQRKILDMCLQEKSCEEILKEVPINDNNKARVSLFNDILSVIGDMDRTNFPERHEVNGEECWIGVCFDAARMPEVVRDVIRNCSPFRGRDMAEITEIIVNSSWSSKYSFARWKKDPTSVAPEIREMIENGL